MLKITFCSFIIISCQDKHMGAIVLMDKECELSLEFSDTSSRTFIALQAMLDYHFYEEV